MFVDFQRRCVFEKSLNVECEIHFFFFKKVRIGIYNWMQKSLFRCSLVQIRQNRASGVQRLTAATVPESPYRCHVCGIEIASMTLRALRLVAGASERNVM
jgi:hypothetical protein